MIIEKYVANPAANAFNYVQVSLARPMRMVDCFAIANFNAATMLCVMFIYRGAIAAFDLANNQYLLYAHYISYNTAVGYGWITPHEVCNVELPPGTYTFACYSTTDVANLKFAYFLQEL